MQNSMNFEQAALSGSMPVTQGFPEQPPGDVPSFDTLAVPLTRGLFAVIDRSSWELVQGWSWRVVPTGRHTYAVGRRKGIDIKLHRLITSAPKGLDVDHINGDGLDNRLSNLRICSHKENIWNRRKHGTGTTSQYKGVYFDKNPGRGRKRWQANLGHTLDGVFTRYRLGWWITEEEAARAYDRKALELFGGFALTNFPREEYAQ